MATRMQMPLRAMCEARRPAKPVWHCIVRNHRDDPHLSDAQWAEIAEQVIGAVGLEGTRWVAVRHDDDGIHLAAVLATEDGRVPRLSWEINKLDALRRRLEPRYCTVRTGTTRTGDRRPTRAEHEKAKRQGRTEPARTTLRRAVNVAAIAAGSDADFLAHLGKAGVMVETRRSTRDPRQITGYKVALPGHHTRDGEVIWYSGRCLGADMTWPKLATRWTPEPAPAAQPPTPRPQTKTDAYVAARRSLREMQSMLRTHPHLAIDLQSPIADVAAALGHAWDGHHDGRRHRHLTAAVGRRRPRWTHPEPRRQTLPPGHRPAAALDCPRDRPGRPCRRRRRPRGLDAGRPPAGLDPRGARRRPTRHATRRPGRRRTSVGDSLAPRDRVASTSAASHDAHRAQNPPSREDRGPCATIPLTRSIARSSGSVPRRAGCRGPRPGAGDACQAPRARRAARVSGTRRARAFRPRRRLAEHVPGAPSTTTCANSALWVKTPCHLPAARHTRSQEGLGPAGHKSRMN